VECTICGMEIDDIEESIEQGWTPYFYEGELEHGPVCPGCSGILLNKAEDGEMELKQEYLGKILYLEGYLEEPSEDEILISIAIENTMQSILN